MKEDTMKAGVLNVMIYKAIVRVWGAKLFYSSTGLMSCADALFKLFVEIVCQSF